MIQLTIEDIEKEIIKSEKELNEPDSRAINLWDNIKIKPQKWTHNQYPKCDTFWVIAIMGNQCVYFNNLEGGWGWGKFDNWGNIKEYHWEQLEIHHVIFQKLFAFDNKNV